MVMVAVRVTAAGTAADPRKGHGRGCGCGHARLRLRSCTAAAAVIYGHGCGCVCGHGHGHGCDCGCVARGCAMAVAEAQARCRLPWLLPRRKRVCLIGRSLATKCGSQSPSRRSRLRERLLVEAIEGAWVPAWRASTYKTYQRLELLAAYPRPVLTLAGFSVNDFTHFF